MALTPRQKQVLELIAGFVRDNGYCPSYEEIGKGLGLASLATVHKHISALEARGFVIGLPLDGNGDETPRCTEARTVGAELSKRTGLPVEFIDERYSTASALRAIREMGGSRKDRKQDVDSLAATVILQQALARAS